MHNDERTVRARFSIALYNADYCGPTIARRFRKRDTVDLININDWREPTYSLLSIRYFFRYSC